VTHNHDISQELDNLKNQLMDIESEVS